MPISAIEINKWSDVHQYDKRARIYRGQANAEWPLKSSLERCCDDNGVPRHERRHFEDRLFREFRRGFHQYVAAAPPPEHTLEWSAIMQHHGAPTRLVDFTYSIYVAAYFAFEATSADNVAIWSIDAQWAASRSVDSLRNAGKTKVDALPDRGTEADETTISELIFSGTPVRMAWPVNPFQLNERLRIQKGTFLVPGDVTLSHMDNLAALPDHDDRAYVVKLVLPRSLRSEALRQLFHMNVSHTSLFPGLDGYARSLGVYHPTVLEPISWR